MWVLGLLVPVTAVVQVGGGVLQGATDFDYQVCFVCNYVYICVCGYLPT